MVVMLVEAMEWGMVNVGMVFGVQEVGVRRRGVWWFAWWPEESLHTWPCHMGILVGWGGSGGIDGAGFNVRDTGGEVRELSGKVVDDLQNHIKLLARCCSGQMWMWHHPLLLNLTCPIPNW